MDAVRRQRRVWSIRAAVGCALALQTAQPSKVLRCNLVADATRARMMISTENHESVCAAIPM